MAQTFMALLQKGTALQPGSLRPLFLNLVSEPVTGKRLTWIPALGPQRIPEALDQGQI